jgi:hypothetical protein
MKSHRRNEAEQRLPDLRWRCLRQGWVRWTRDIGAGSYDREFGAKSEPHWFGEENAFSALADGGVR